MSSNKIQQRFFASKLLALHYCIYHGAVPIPYIQVALSEPALAILT